MGSPTNPEFQRIRANTATDALIHVWKPDFKNPDMAEGFLPVVVKGGIGDLIVAMPLLRRIRKEVGEIRVFTNHREIFEIFDEKKMLAPARYFDGYDHWLAIETAPRFYFDKNFLGFKNERVEALYKKMREIRGEHPQLARFCDYQPNFDHELAVAAMDTGLDRYSLPFFMMGFEPELAKLDLPVDPMIDLRPYVTIHDGFDTSQVDVLYRSTKSWNMNAWADVVAILHDEMPGVSVVQLGTKQGRAVPGVDFDRRGELTLHQSFNLLRSSQFHIDGDSGLVHAAHAMGVKSAVVFGSTPSKFFGYRDNINFAPNQCGGCWWLTRSWMRKCPLYTVPVCIDSIGPETVASAVLMFLSGDKNGNGKSQSQRNGAHI